MKKIIVILTILLCQNIVNAQQTAWFKGKNLGNNLAHQVIDNCSASDSDAYYLAGYLWSTQLLSGATLPNGPTNGFVLKLNQNGDTLWSWKTNSSATQAGDGVYIRAICNSPNNTVTVGGYYASFSGSSNIAGQTVSGTGSFIVRLNPNGQVAMVRTYPSLTIYDLDCDLFGTYYFTGSSQQKVIFGNDTIGPPPTGAGVANTLDYLGSARPNGNPSWIRQLGYIDMNSTTAGNEGGQHRLTVCNTANPSIVTAGFFTGTYSFANQNLTSSGSDDALIIRFDTLGNYKSHFTFGGSNSESLHDIRSNSSGKFVVGGTYRTATTLNGTSYSVGGSYYQALLIKMDTALNILHHDTGAVSGWFPRVAIDEYGRTALAVFGGKNVRFLWTYNDTGGRIFTKTLSYTSGTTSFASVNPLGLAFSKKNDNTLYFGAVFKPDGMIDSIQISSTQSHNFDIAAGKFSLPSLCRTNLGPDTGYCGSFQRNLSTGLTLPLDSVMWSTGATTSTIQVSQPGTYWVYTSLRNCSYKDSITITQNTALPTFTNLTDTFLCHQNKLTVSLPDNNALHHMWSDQSKGDSIQVPSNRNIIWIQYGNYCGNVRDSMAVTRLQIPAIQLGKDTTLCPQQTLTLGTFFKGTTYSWSNGDTTFQIQASAPGMLTCTASNLCGTGHDTINLFLLNYPLVSLGADTFFCGNSAFTIQSQSTYDSTLIWNNGKYGNSLTVSNAGLYWLQAGNRCGTMRDSIVISKFNFPAARINGDSLLCTGDSLTLSGTFSGQILWDDSSTSTSRTVKQGGTYWLQAANQCGTAFDSLMIQTISKPKPDLGHDTLICQNSFQLTLSPNTNANSYSWNSGSRQSSLTIQNPGWYWVDASNRCGTARDSIFVDQGLAPVVNLGNDTLVRPGFSITLDGGAQGSHYQWSTSVVDTLRYLAVNQPGKVWVTVSNKCGSATDTIHISLNTGLHPASRKFVLYPNPAKTGITISSTGNELPAKARIYQTDGRLVREVAMQGESSYFQLDDLKPGLYFIQIDANWIPFSIIE